MALFDFLKRKKQVEKAKKTTEKKPWPGRPAKVSAAKETKEKPVAVEPQKAKKHEKGFSYEAIKQPHISEKASYLAEKDQYIFEILPNYNKNEIKKAVEGLYGVDVLSVNMIKIPAKKRRLGRTEGFRKAYKKAVVKIKEGQKIEIL
jgi:large subunit ribosomal protein L23